MKAAVRTAYGPPESVRVTEIATPEPGPDEVLVRVRASSVNRTDGDRVCGYNEKTFGAHAEYMTIRADGVEEAATSFEGSHYALANLRAGGVGRRGQPRRSETTSGRA